MLRVFSAGFSLPQSILALQSFRLSTWDLSFHSQRIYQVRPVSDFATRFPEPPAENVSEEDRTSENKEGPQHIAQSARRGNLFRHELLRKSIRPLRPLRPPPKYASTPEPLGASAKTKSAAQHVLVHSSHRISQDEKDVAVSVSFMDGLIPKDTSSSRESQSNVRRPESRGRDALLSVLAKTHSISEAWEAYEMLLKLSRRHVSPGPVSSRPANRRASLVIPYEYLHRLTRLLSTTHPRTRSLFVRLLSVITTLRDTGGTIFVWEWNALIDCAGKGWRKTTIDDYRSALSVFKDMVVSGQNVPFRNQPIDLGSASLEKSRPVAKPDIVTFTTLLDIASRSHSESAINHAISLLEASDLPWNQVTHMAKLRYFIRTRQLDAVLGILREAVRRGLDLPTLNGCLWAFAQSGRLRVALEVYEHLRRNVPKQDRTDFGGRPGPTSEQVDQIENPILNVAQYALPRTMRPDKITYTLLIQATCYHGDFISAMRIFRDMVSTVDPATRVQQDHPVGRPTVPSFYKPSLAVYRAIFLGFARHAHKRKTFTSALISKQRNVDGISLSEFAARLTPSDPGTGARSAPHEQPENRTHWTLKNLETLFKSFLEIGWDENSTVNGLGDSAARERPSDRMIYWIMVAYAKTTRRDVGKMYEVWRELDARFGYGEGDVKIWTGRIARLGEQLEISTGDPML